MDVDIIIPSYNQSALTVACLQSIRKCTKDYRIIFVDNASINDELNVILDELENHPHLLIRNWVNQGFVKATNQGLCMSTSPYIVLLNNDTEVCENWIEKLKVPFENSLVGAVGPVTDSQECWQGREALDESYRIISTKSMLAFFCVMLNRRTVDTIGLLDESYGIGLADDDDYCKRIHLEGYRLALAQNLLIKHHHRSTFNLMYSKETIEDLTKQGYELFNKKYDKPKRR